MWDCRRPTHTAYHEAGHAVACWVFKAPLVYATILPSDDYAGAVLHRPVSASCKLDRHERGAIISFAGPAAQRRKYPRSDVEQGATSDHAKVELTAEVLFEALHSRRSFIRKAAGEAKRLVATHWFAVDKVARELQRSKALSGVALDRIITQAEQEWAQISGYHPDVSAFDFVKARAALARGLPPLRRSIIAAAALRAMLDGATDIESVVITELTSRGYPEQTCRAEWTRAKAQNRGRA